MKNILFISPNASSSGAPKLLLQFAKALKETDTCNSDFIFINGGVLEPEFRQLGNVTILSRTNISIVSRIYNKLINQQQKKISKIDFSKYDAIVLNTITTGDIVPVIKQLFKGKIICYVHELKIVTEYLTTPTELSDVKENSDLIFVPSESIKVSLAENFGFEKHKIIILPSYIPESSVIESTEKDVSAFVVGGCGTVELRKGTDIYIQLALYLKKGYPEINIKFKWQGADQNSLDYKFLNEDIVKLGLSNNFEFLLANKNVDNFYNSLDVFILTSREDPYPLVVLEAANAQVPSICFDQSGGAVDFIQGNGYTIDYLDISKMAEKIIWYYHNPEERKKDGINSKLKLKQLHQDKEAICNTFIEYI